MIRGRTNLLEPLPLAAPMANFIFWGRLSAEKNLSEAINFLNNVRSQSPQANLTIVGPDCGELNRLEQQVGNLNLLGNVTFAGPSTIGEIVTLAKGASFYLQTSLREGLSQSVLEAMSLGLVPIVTPVGEIGNYCRDGENAIPMGRPSEAAKEVLSVLNNSVKFDLLRSNAITTAAEFPKFSEEFILACRAALANRGTQ